MATPAKNTKKTMHLKDFQELREVLQNSETFGNFQFKEIAQEVFTLYQEGQTQIFLGPSIWGNRSEMEPYLKNSQSNGISVLCVGKDSELEQIPDRCNKEHIQLLSLPMSIRNLKSCISNIYYLTTMINKANVEKQLVNEIAEEVKYVLSISRELNGERNIPKLLNLILHKAREITKADAGSIYTVKFGANDKIKNATLQFRLTQNHSIKQNLTEFEMPVDESSIVGNAVINGTTISIPDLYELSDESSENPFGAKHDSSWDRRIGYESHSMLTVPMFDISHGVIGVIQLINRRKSKKQKLLCPQDFEDYVIPFDENDIEYAEIVAQQAGIALENANMQDDIQRLFDGFVNASVTAIEQRDPTTSGHSHRVAKFTTTLAEAVDRSKIIQFRDITFDVDEMREIKYASLLHDFGKLGVRENVLVKAKKLYPWQYQLIEQRFQLIRASLKNEYLTNMLNIFQHPNAVPLGINQDHLRLEFEKKCAELDHFFNFIQKANEPTVLEQGGFELLKDIANCDFFLNGKKDHPKPYLLPDELTALSVSRGSLTAEEFAEIQSHVKHTYEFLRKIPWGRKMANIPQIAAKHHEKLDGSGYPTSAASHEIPVQSRMMTIADIYDALTASDRPYKRAIPTEKALDILGMEVKGGKIDPDLYSIFIEAKIFEACNEKSS